MWLLYSSYETFGGIRENSVARPHGCGANRRFMVKFHPDVGFANSTKLRGRATGVRRTCTLAV